jgi:hypothetical protein
VNGEPRSDAQTDEPKLARSADGRNFSPDLRCFGFEELGTTRIPRLALRALARPCLRGWRPRGDRAVLLSRWLAR